VAGGRVEGDEEHAAPLDTYSLDYVDTRMQVTFQEEGGRTRLTIVQSGFPTPGLRDEFAGGWAGILDGLGRVVAARAAR